MFTDDSMPIFVKIKEKIKDDIMDGTYAADELIISTTQIAKLFNVNPATAVKSVSMLQNEGIVYKKRGIGICVAAGAKEKICLERKAYFEENALPQFVETAKKLGNDKNKLIAILSEVKDYD